MPIPAYIDCCQRPELHVLRTLYQSARDTTDPDGADLSFLASRPSWLDDSEGARRVSGAPDRPWS